ncbi:MAG: efflux RND transporter permease subunit, partial [Gammaproteobacteria bacterium]
MSIHKTRPHQSGVLINLMKAIPDKSILVLVLFSAIVCLSGLFGLKTNADYRVYFDSNDPLLQTDSLLAEQYARLDSLLLILSVDESTLLEPALIELYPELKKQLEGIEHVKRVTGFFDFSEDENNFEFDVTSSDSNTDEGLLKRLRAHPRAMNMITQDGSLGLLEVGVSLPGINAAKEVKQFMTAIEAVINTQLNSLSAPVDVHYTGTLALNEAYIDVVRDDLKRFIPGLFLIFLICLFAFFRHWGISLFMIATALLSALVTFGIVGWLGWELAAINAFTPIIIMSLNIATSMHVVVSYLRSVSEGESRTDAMAQSVHYNLKALTLSKLTTALGFLLLAFSPSPPIQIVGFTIAIGMLVSYVLCLTLLRIVLPVFRLTQEQAGVIVSRLSLDALGTWILLHRIKIVLFSVVIIVISVLSLKQLQINDDVYDYFSEDHRFRQGTELIERHFDGSIRLFYSLQSNAELGVLAPDFAKSVKGFTAWLRAQDIVARVDDVYSLADKRGVRLNTIRPVLETSSPEMLGLEQELSDDYRAVKISVILKAVTAKQILTFNEQAQSWLDANHSPFTYQGGVGPDVLFAKLGERNARSMFFSLSLALIMIALVIGVLLRSWSAIFIGMVCNLLPVITVFAI